MTVNGSLSFNAGTYLWSLLANTNAGSGNFSAPLNLNGNLSVTNGSLFSLDFAPGVSVTNSFWSNNTSWTVMTGGLFAQGTNFQLSLSLAAQSAGFNSQTFVLQTNGNALLLDYIAPNIQVITTNNAGQIAPITNAPTQIVNYSGNSSLSTNSNTMLIGITVNGGSIVAPSTNSLPTNCNVTVNNGTFAIQQGGTNTINAFLVTGGTVNAAATNGGNNIVEVSGFTMTGGTLAGGSNTTYWAASYLFNPSNAAANVNVTLADAGNLPGSQSTAVITNATGQGTVTFTSQMTYNGGTTISGSTLQLGSGSSSGSVVGVITNYGTLAVGYNSNTLLTNTVSGTGTISQVGSNGVLTLSTNATANFNGTLAASGGGTLRISASNQIGGATNFLLADSGVLQLTNTNAMTLTNPITVTAGTGIVENSGTNVVSLGGSIEKTGTVFMLAGGSFNVSGQITGNSGSFNSDLVLSNASATFTAGSNNYVGPTYLIAGSALSNGIVNALPTNTVLVFGTNTDGLVTNRYSMNGFNQTIAGIASSGNAVNLITNGSGPTVDLTLSGSTNTTYAGSIAGNITLRRVGAGTTTLSGNNTYTNGTVMYSGGLRIASSNALGSGQFTLAGGNLILDSLLTINTLNWSNSSSTNSIVSINDLTAGHYINVTDTVFPISGTNYFDLSGATLSSMPTRLLSFGTNNGATIFSTNQFDIIGVSNYALSISNNTLWVVLSTLPVPNGSTNTISGTVTYPSIQFGTNSTLNIAPSGNLTITSPTVVINNSVVSLSGSLTVSNSLGINPGSQLNGSGVLNVPQLNNSGVITMNGMRVNGSVSNAGVLTGSGTINGSLTLAPAGSLILWASSSDTYNHFTVGGNVSLGGRLIVTGTNGYGLAFGDQYTFINSQGPIKGVFSEIDMPAGFRGRLVIAGDPTATLIVAPISYTQMAVNQNQTNVATALNSFIPATGGDQQVVSTSLDILTASQYNQAFNAIMPTFYQQIATIAFNNANAQNMQLVQRLWGLRVAEGGGFAMSGFADTTPFLEGQGDGNSVMDPSKDILRPGLDNHWGMFVDINGIFANANSGNMLPGYNSQSGGVTTGLTFRVNPKLSVGAYTGYQGAYTKSGANGSGLGTGSRLIDNAVRFGVFGTYGQADGKGLFVNALAGGGYHNFQATRVIQYTGMNRTANSTPGAGELDTMIAAGYDIQRGKFSFGPTASLQYTYLGVNSLNETGAQSLSFNSGGWNSSSLLSSIGAHAAYTWYARKLKGHEIVVVPQVNLNWQHEFMQNPYAINGNLGGTSPTFSNWSAAPIRDTLYTGVGLSVEFADRWNTSFFYNASAGNSDLHSQNIFWSIGRKF